LTTDCGKANDRDQGFLLEHLTTCGGGLGNNQFYPGRKESPGRGGTRREMRGTFGE
jgi:hypothetical protein